MIGIIITGHGKFASGINTALNLIVGEQKNVVSVDFTENQGSQDLKKELEKRIQEMEVEGILILSDLAGGTPFNQSVFLSNENRDKNILVMAGTNLPMLLEIVMMKDLESLEALAIKAKEAGTIGIKQFEISEKVSRESIKDDMDGI